MEKKRVRQDSEQNSSFSSARKRERNSTKKKEETQNGRHGPPGRPRARGLFRARGQACGRKQEGQDGAVDRSGERETEKDTKEKETMPSISRRGAVAPKPTPTLFLPSTTPPPPPKPKQAEQTTLSAIQAGRRAALTRAEIEAAPETAATWAAVGRA